VTCRRSGLLHWRCGVQAVEEGTYDSSLKGGDRLTKRARSKSRAIAKITNPPDDVKSLSISLRKGTKNEGREIFWEGK